MKNEERLELIKQVGEEIITEEELKKLLSEKKKPTAYDGFEPSGRIHIAQGLMRAINVNKMTEAGCTFKMLVADWHAWLNNKFGGDLEKIQIAGEYFVEVWKASGMNLDNVKFVNCSDFVADQEYWKKVVRVARSTTISRMMRCGQIMGRKEGEIQHVSMLLYPAMQAADIFQLEADICQLGMDQRKVNILAREIAPKLGCKPPVAVHHHMLMGLLQPQSQDKDVLERTIALKMSKSNPDSSIFMDDSRDEIQRKMGKAWCPEKQTTENPVLEYCKYIIFERFKTMKIKRPARFGGDIEVGSYSELERAYSEGKVHPMDLKNSASEYLDKLIDPVRKHFTKGKAEKLLEKVKSFTVTR
ncbi:MAG TPA: tyrosine--tRNA ligase [Candidatus Nanoarchaeia archaeon]|nr:tyrosine--tRNA ligase [Candidatus Nanoarchaeia archaeon]